MLTADVHELVRPLRPQEFGRTRPTSVPNAIIEPAWPGIRVLAAVGSGSATLWDQGDAIEGFDSVQAALARATSDAADAAIFEGYVTKQILSDRGTRAPSHVSDAPTITGQITKMFIGGRRRGIEDIERRREAEIAEAPSGAEDDVNLVVVDLLWLDGEWLLDVPLLERRRILESIVTPNELVRPGLFVRHPIGSWIGSWRAQGFSGLTYKAPNSRYRPGETAEDWTRSDLPRR